MARTVVEPFLRHGLNWPSAAPQPLRDLAVEQLLKPRGMDFESYGTARMLGLGSDRAERCRLQVDDRATIVVELLAPHVRDRFRALGLSFRDSSSPITELPILTRAISALSAIPDVQASVGALVRVAHVLRTEHPDLDCSFSDPELPFSIFVSVPSGEVGGAVERALEAVIHETLHLQLSLINRVIPLCRPDEPSRELLYSPWKDEPRTPLGVLHGIYVFAILRRVWGALAASGDGAARLFARRRVAGITRELSTAPVQELRATLTSPGKQMLGRLFTTKRSSGA